MCVSILERSKREENAVLYRNEKNAERNRFRFYLLSLYVPNRPFVWKRTDDRAFQTGSKRTLRETGLNWTGKPAHQSKESRMSCVLGRIAKSTESNRPSTDRQERWEQPVQIGSIRSLITVGSGWIAKNSGSNRFSLNLLGLKIRIAVLMLECWNGSHLAGSERNAHHYFLLTVSDTIVHVIYIYIWAW